MDVLDKTATVWVVTDEAGDVVVICSGHDAREAADDWVALGYAAVCIPAEQVHPI